MHTFKSVVEQLGDEAQVTGGAIVVYRDGKHIEVGRVLPETGTFVMTPAGRQLLEVEEKPAKKPSKKPAKKPEASALDDLGDLGEE